MSGGSRPLPCVCQQCGQPCRATYGVTRHKSVLPVALHRPFKSWLAVRVCERCLGPATLENENLCLPSMQRREVWR